MRHIMAARVSLQQVWAPPLRPLSLSSPTLSSSHHPTPIKVEGKHHTLFFYGRNPEALRPSYQWTMTNWFFMNHAAHS